MRDDSKDAETRGGARTSDTPMDLAKERETFVRSFLRKGVEYTELLLRENEDIRSELASMRADNARLRAQVASDDAIRDLLRTIEGLEAERGALLARSQALEESKQRTNERQAEIEQEVNDLANLYIATVQLHASLSPRRVVRHLRDMCGQLVGALGFVIYLLDEGGENLVPIAHEGLEGAHVVSIPLGHGAVGDAAVTGLLRIRETGDDAITPGTHDDPVAVVPLTVDGQTIGAISILTLLGQKRGWASVDRELFQLLGSQAGVALIAANLYHPSTGPRAALRGIADKL